jgi:hypothetical protein
MDVAKRYVKINNTKNTTGKIKNKIPYRGKISLPYIWRKINYLSLVN